MHRIVLHTKAKTWFKSWTHIRREAGKEGKRRGEKKNAGIENT